MWNLNCELFFLFFCSDVMDSVSVAIVAFVITFVIPFLPSPITVLFRVCVLVWPVAAPFAQATARNARFRLRLAGSGDGTGVARLVCGNAWLDNDDDDVVLVDDGSVCVSLQLPYSPPSALPQPACALVVGTHVVDILLTQSGQRMTHSPFVYSKALQEICSQACAEA